MISVDYTRTSESVQRRGVDLKVRSVRTIKMFTGLPLGLEKWGAISQPDKSEGILNRLESSANLRQMLFIIFSDI